MDYVYERLLKCIQFFCFLNIVVLFPINSVEIPGIVNKNIHCFEK